MSPRFRLTERQTLAWNALHDKKFRRVLYGGAKGGGKSWLLCVWLYLFCCWCIKKFDLQPSKNPPHIGWFGRKQATDFTATTLQTWRTIIPESTYELKGGSEKEPKHILINKSIALDYGGLDRQESINKFNSAEYAVIGVDQAEEVSRDDISVLRGSMRLKIKGKALPYMELYTANPRVCWLRDDFIIDKLPRGVFVPALPKDNPHLPDDYIQTLIDAFGYRPELLAAYLEGDWSVIEDPAQVILDKWIQKAVMAKSGYQGTLLTCDPARFGDNKTIIFLLKGTQIELREEMAYSRTTKISDRLNDLSRENNNCAICVDTVGVGAGVADELHEWGRHVIEFNGAEKAEDDKKYYNKRAEAWWECAQDFAAGNLGVRRLGTELRRQLCAPQYTFRNGKILIEKKEDIVDRLGYSPDEGDAYVNGIWALKRLRPQPLYSEIGAPEERRKGRGAYGKWRPGRKRR